MTATIYKTIECDTTSIGGVYVDVDSQLILLWTMAIPKSDYSGIISGCCKVPGEKNAAERCSAPRDLCHRG